MLKIKKLQIQGFKSFCDRTELLFPGSGVVGVVGPNGCGKSNVADAIGWVLGEQSVKSLRGQRMEDVIFAGSRDRTPSGLAEVSLTLIDPEVYQTSEDLEDPAIEIEDGWETAEAAPAEDGAATEADAADSDAQEASSSGAVVLSIRKRRKFPTQQRAGEVVVTRRLFRSGDSEYLLNGRPCRLRDIQDIFMGTGLGPESYAIIEQGRIGQLLAAKPYERRGIIEEAAGVTKYKAKRKLAEAKLESARQNLARINDIFEEVTRQMASLKRQAAKARRYAELKTEHDEKLRHLLVSQAAGLGRRQSESRAEFEHLRGEAEAAQARVRQLDAERAQTQQTALEHETRLRAADGELSRLTVESERAQGQMEFHRQQLEETVRQKAARETALAGLTALRAELAAEGQALRETAQALGGEMEGARALHRDACAASQREAQLAAAIEQRSEALRLRLLQLLGEISALGHQAAENEAAVTAHDRQLARYAEELAAARGEADALEQRRQELAATGQIRRQELAELAGRQAAAVALLAALRDELGQLGPRREELRARKADVTARRRSLEEMIAHHGYSSEAVRNLFQPSGVAGGFRPLGVLADFLEVDPVYEAVVEEFLRDELNYVVVHNWDEADAGLGIVRQDAQGRVTFLVHPEDGQYSMFAPGEIENGAVPGAAGAAEQPMPLKKCVRVLNGFGQSLEHILPKLGSGYIVPRGALARQLAGENPRAYFLTAQGECFHRQTVSGGARSGAGPLSLKRELRDAARQEGELREDLEKIERRITELEADRGAAESGSQELQAAAHQLEKDALALQQSLEQVQREAARAQERRRLHETEIERTQTERRQACQRLETLQQQRQTADQGRQAAEVEQQQLAEASHAARLRREEAGQHQATTQSELARLEERSLALAGQMQRLEARRHELAEQAERHAQEGRQAEFRRQELATAIQAGQEAVAAMASQRDQQAAIQARETAALETQRGRLRELDPEIQSLREAWDGLRERQSGCEVRLARLASDLEHLAQTFQHDLGQELTPDLIPAEGPDEAALAAWAEEVRELRSRIEHLGPVNLMALEEFQETEQRHQFLETQRKDLFDSIADTQKAIQEIDAITRQQFAEAFEKINVYFQETFRTLFGGGQGFLRLTDADNNPDGGVDIVAQPPGKKLQNAMLLSGGEKAMTALALLVAVFRFQPSPFCVLDEVDAPLDDANIGRFTQMVREMSGQTQFIIITHSRKTMEIAPLLYGVTMPQSGVSRIVSVRMEEDRKRAG